MRKLLITLCAGLTACACLAGSGYQSRISMGTNTAVSAVMPQTVRGAVDTVYVAAYTNGASAAATTGTVWITYVPHNGAGSQLIVSNAITGSGVFRPRVTGHNMSGVALAADTTGATNKVASTVLSIPYERIRLSGESVTVAVSNSTTNIQWRSVIVTD